MAALHSLDGILHVGPDRLQTPDLIALLDDLYCGPVAVEFLHLQVNILTIVVLQSMQTVSDIYLKRICLLDSSASSALGVLDDNCVI